MRQKLITLIMVISCMALFRTSYAVELSQTGVEIHGFLTQGYLITDKNNFYADTEDGGTTQFNEFGINFGADVSERLRIGAQFFARDLGKMGDNEVTLDWAVADYSFADWLNLRAGKLKMPYGLYNAGRDVDLLRTFVFLPQSVYIEGWRDSANALNGAGFYGYIPAGIVGNFEYHMYGGNSSVPADSGVARLLEDQTPIALGLDVVDVDVKYTNTGQLAWDTIFGLDGLKLVGGSWGIEFDALSEVNNGNVIPEYDPSDTSFPPTAAGYTLARSQTNFHVRTVNYYGSLEYAIGNLVFAGEYTLYKYKMTLEGVAPTSRFDSEGYYGSLTYRFFDWLEVGTYYSKYYSDTDDKDGKKAVASGQIPAGQEHTQWLEDICLALRFDISANWVFKMEGHKMNGAALLYSDDGNLNDAGTAVDYSEDWHMFAAKLSFNF